VQTEPEKLFRHCIQLNARHSGAHQYLGRILAQDKLRWNIADGHYQKVRLRAKVKWFFLLGPDHCKDSLFIRFGLQALESAPDNIDIMVEYANFLKDCGGNKVDQNFLLVLN